MIEIIKDALASGVLGQYVLVIIVIYMLTDFFIKILKSKKEVKDNKSGLFIDFSSFDEMLTKQDKIYKEIEAVKIRSEVETTNLNRLIVEITDTNAKLVSELREVKNKTEKLEEHYSNLVKLETRVEYIQKELDRIRSKEKL